MCSSSTKSTRWWETRAAHFEEAYRDAWMPMLAEGSDARLLWYFDHAHGSGPAYRVVTVTGVEDGSAVAPAGGADGHRGSADVGPSPRRTPARVTRAAS